MRKKQILKETGGVFMKIIFYGTREYDHYYFDVLAADPEYGCEIRFLTANLDADTAPLAQGGDAVCAFVSGAGKACAGGHPLLAAAVRRVQ